MFFRQLAFLKILCFACYLCMNNMHSIAMSPAVVRFIVSACAPTTGDGTTHRTTRLELLSVPGLTVNSRDRRS